MKIKILKQCQVAGKTAETDTVIEATDKDAKYLIAIGKAEAFKDAPKIKKADK